VHEGNMSYGVNLLPLSALLQFTCLSLTYQYTYYLVSYYYILRRIVYIFIISLVGVCHILLLLLASV